MVVPKRGIRFEVRSVVCWVTQSDLRQLRDPFMLETISAWGEAAKTGGPWFLVACMGAITVLGGRWLYTRGEERETKLRAELAELQKGATLREKSCAEEKDNALKAQAALHEERYDALREESRDQHARRNDEIKEVAITMTSALQADAAAKHLQSKALDEMKQELVDLTREIHDLSKRA